MVQVSATRPILACIVFRGEREPLSACPVCSLSAIIVLANVRSPHLVGFPVISLGRKVHPRAVNAQIVSMIDDDIGNKASSSFPIGCNHASEFPFRAKRTLLVEIIDGHITHRIVVGIAPTTLRNPDQLKVWSNLVSLSLELRPRGLVIGIPIETLQHNPLIIIGPALRKDAQMQSRRQKQNGESFHVSKGLLKRSSVKIKT